jgi:hypothetical protein
MPGFVKSYGVWKALEKLQVNTRSGVVAKALKEGIV